MTLTEAMHRDPIIAAYLVAAFLATVYIVCRVVDVLGRFAYARFCMWRTRRYIAACRRADERTRDRRRREAMGDTLVDELRQQFDGLEPFSRRR